MITQGVFVLTAVVLVVVYLHMAFICNYPPGTCCVDCPYGCLMPIKDHAVVLVLVYHMAFTCNCPPGTRCVDCPHGCLMPLKDHDCDRVLVPSDVCTRECQKPVTSDGNDASDHQNGFSFIILILVAALAINACLIVLYHKSRKLQELLKMTTEDPIVSPTIYNEEILNKIRPLFVTYVIPGNILHMFHHYNSKVLVQQDIERVDAVTSSCGPTAGASELLKHLIRYKGWFKCLLLVLRNPQVKQGHVADEMLKALDPNRRQMLELC